MAVRHGSDGLKRWLVDRMENMLMKNNWRKSGFDSMKTCHTRQWPNSFPISNINVRPKGALMLIFHHVCDPVYISVTFISSYNSVSSALLCRTF